MFYNGYICTFDCGPSGLVNYHLTKLELYAYSVNQAV